MITQTQADKAMEDMPIGFYDGVTAEVMHWLNDNQRLIRYSLEALRDGRVLAPLPYGCQYDGVTIFVSDHVNKKSCSASGQTPGEANISAIDFIKREPKNG